MTTDDHTADQCDYSWCTAHTHPDECTCPYAQASPHRRVHCRYATDDQPADESATEHHHA